MTFCRNTIYGDDGDGIYCLLECYMKLVIVMLKVGNNDASLRAHQLSYPVFVKSSFSEFSDFMALYKLVINFNFNLTLL